MNEFFNLARSTSCQGMYSTSNQSYVEQILKLFTAL